MSKIRAFIDLGTNTFHLLIAEISDEKINILYRTKQIVGLGAGGINENKILPDAIKRGLDCLQMFKEKCNYYQVEIVNAYGTSALRNATNRSEFVELIHETTGIDIRVIDGTLEAELIQLGISSSLKNIEGPYMIMDIGGGSTEFILVQDKKIILKRSFEVGVQRLLSKYLKDDPIPNKSFEELFDYLNSYLSELIAFREYQPQMLIGASGTYTTLLRMYSEENKITDPDITVPTEYFSTIFKKLIHSTKEERLMLPGMSSARVDLIVVGSCLVEFVLNYFKFDGFMVSGNGLKEGAMLLASKGKI